MRYEIRWELVPLTLQSPSEGLITSSVFHFCAHLALLTLADPRCKSRELQGSIFLFWMNKHFCALVFNGCGFLWFLSNFALWGDVCPEASETRMHLWLCDYFVVLRSCMYQMTSLQSLPASIAKHHTNWNTTPTIGVHKGCGCGEKPQLTPHNPQRVLFFFLQINTQCHAILHCYKRTEIYPRRIFLCHREMQNSLHSGKKNSWGGAEGDAQGARQIFGPTENHFLFFSILHPGKSWGFSTLCFILYLTESTFSLWCLCSAFYCEFSSLLCDQCGVV